MDIGCSGEVVRTPNDSFFPCGWLSWELWWVESEAWRRHWRCSRGRSFRAERAALRCRGSIVVVEAQWLRGC